MDREQYTQFKVLKNFCTAFSVKTHPLTQDDKGTKKDAKKIQGRRERPVSLLYSTLNDLSKRLRGYIEANTTEVVSETEKRIYRVPTPNYSNEIVNRFRRDINSVVELINTMKFWNCRDYLENARKLTTEDKQVIYDFLNAYATLDVDPSTIAGFDVANKHQCVFKKARSFVGKHGSALDDFIHHKMNGKVVDQAPKFRKKIANFNTFVNRESKFQARANPGANTFDAIQQVPTRSLDATRRFLKHRAVKFVEDKPRGHKPILVISKNDYSRTPSEYKDNLSTTKLSERQAPIKEAHFEPKIARKIKRGGRVDTYDEDDTVFKGSGGYDHNQTLNWSHGSATGEDDVDNWERIGQNGRLREETIEIVHDTQIDITGYPDMHGMPILTVVDAAWTCIRDFDYTETYRGRQFFGVQTKYHGKRLFGCAELLVLAYLYVCIQAEPSFANVLRDSCTFPACVETFHDYFIARFLHDVNRVLSFVPVVGKYGFSTRDLPNQVSQFFTERFDAIMPRHWIIWREACHHKFRVVQNYRARADVVRHIRAIFRGLRDCRAVNDFLECGTYGRITDVNQRSYLDYGEHLESMRDKVGGNRRNLWVKTYGVCVRNILGFESFLLAEGPTNEVAVFMSYGPAPYTTRCDRLFRPRVSIDTVLALRRKLSNDIVNRVLDCVSPSSILREFEVPTQLNGLNGEATNSDDRRARVSYRALRLQRVPPLHQNIDVDTRRDLDGPAVAIEPEHESVVESTRFCRYLFLFWLSVTMLVTILGLVDNSLVTNRKDYGAKCLLPYRLIGTPPSWCSTHPARGTIHTFDPAIKYEYDGSMDDEVVAFLNGANGEATNSDDVYDNAASKRTRKRAENSLHRKPINGERNDEDDMTRRKQGKPRVAPPAPVVKESREQSDSVADAELAALIRHDGLVPVAVRSGTAPQYVMSKGKYLYCDGYCTEAVPMLDVLEQRHCINAEDECKVDRVEGFNHAYIQYGENGEPMRSNAFTFKGKEFLSFYKLTFSLVNVYTTILVFLPLFNWLIRSYTPTVINESVFKTALHKCYNQSIYIGLASDVIENVVQAFVDFKHNQLTRFLRLGLAGPQVEYVKDTLNDVNNYSRCIDEYECGSMLRCVAVVANKDYRFNVRYDVSQVLIGFPDNTVVVFNDGTTDTYARARAQMKRGWRVDQHSVALVDREAHWWYTQFVRFIGKLNEGFIVYDQHLLNGLFAQKRIIGSKEDVGETEEYYNLGAWSLFMALLLLTGPLNVTTQNFLDIAGLRFNHLLFDEAELVTMERLKCRIRRNGCNLYYNITFDPKNFILEYDNPYLGKFSTHTGVGSFCKKIENDNKFLYTTRKSREVAYTTALEAINELEERVQGGTYFNHAITYAQLTSALMLYFVLYYAFSLYDEYAAREYMAEYQHKKKALRKLWVEGEYRENPDSIAGSVLAAKLKREFAKFGKACRFFVSYASGAMYACEVPEIIKGAIDGEYEIWQGDWHVIIHIFAKRKPNDLDRFFNDLMQKNTRQSIHIGIYSDDSVYSLTDENGEIHLFNVDISSCDSSQREGVFGIVHRLISKINLRTANALLRQCTQPIVFTDPDDNNRRVQMNVDGFFEGSGTVLTTLLNHVASYMIARTFVGLILTEFNVEASYESLIAFAAAHVGHKVSVQRCELVEELQFLKYSPMYTVEGEIVAVRNDACTLRSFGTVDQDLTATSCNMPTAVWNSLNWEGRFEFFGGSVVESLKNEPTTPVIKALRTRFPVKGTGASHKPFNVMERCRNQSDKVIALSSYLRRYKCTESEIKVLQDQIEHSKFGWCYASNAVSYIMKADYDVPFSPQDQRT